MKKHILSGFLFLLLLAGCGQPAASPGETENAIRETAPPVVAFFPAREEPMEISSELKPGPEQFELENNGGYYVQIGDNVYFRKYGKETLERSAVWGAFLTRPLAQTNPDDPDSYSEILCYHPSTRRTETLFTESGHGGLYYGNGGLYLTEPLGDIHGVVWYSLDGSVRQEICAGKIVGASPKGDLIAADRHDRENNAIRILTICRDGVPTGEVEYAGGLACVGLSEEFLFFLTYDPVSGQRQLWQISAYDGETLCLGTLPDWTANYTGEVGEFYFDENRLTFTVGFYKGSGHYLERGMLLTAVASQPDSLLELDWQIPDALPLIESDTEGNLKFTSHRYGEMKLENGDLLYYNGEEFETLRYGVTPEPDAGRGIRTVAQTMECVNDVVYLTLAIAHAAPAENVGWRDSYLLLEMFYFAIPIDSNREVQLAYMDYETELTGYAWFAGRPDSIPGALLWQQEANGRLGGELYLEYLSSQFVYLRPDGSAGSMSELLRDIGETMWYDTEDPALVDLPGYPALGDSDAAFPIRFKLNRAGQVYWITQNQGEGNDDSHNALLY